MPFIKSLILIVIVICDSCGAREIPSDSIVLKYVENHLPHCGVLKNSGRFVYVDVDDEYIHKLISFIQKDGFEEPPYFGAEDLVGAHISVIYPEEIKKFIVEDIQECGETISFTPKRCEVVNPPIWQGIDEVYFIVVEAPELDRIREKYGLPKRKYEFHITIGVKPKVAEAS